VTRARAFTKLELTSRFDKSFARLSAKLQEQCEATLHALLQEPLRPGLRLKPVLPGKTYWEVRINRADRLIIFPQGNVAYIMDIVTHDEIGKWGS
jgi:hypothetical protein